MSNNTSVVSIRIDALTAQASQAMNAFFNGLSSRMKTFSEMNSFVKESAESINKLASATAAYLSVEAMKRFVEKSIEAKEAINELDNALTNQGTNTEEYRKKLEALREELEKTAKIPKDKSLIAQATLVEHGIKPEDMAVMIQRSADLGAMMKGDITQGAFALSQAISGNGIALRNFRIEVDTTIPKAQALKQFFDVLDSRTKGAAAARSNALPTGYSEMKESIDELQKTIGNDIAESGIYKQLALIAEVLRRMDPDVRHAIEAFVALSAAIEGVSVAMIALSPAFASVRTGIAMLAGADLVGIFAGATKVTNGLGMAFKAYLPELIAFGSRLALIFADIQAVATIVSRFKNVYGLPDDKEQAAVAKQNLISRVQAEVAAQKTLVASLKETGAITDEEAAHHLRFIAAVTTDWAMGIDELDTYADKVKEKSKELNALQPKPKAETVSPALPFVYTPEMVRAQKDAQADVEKAKIELEMAGEETQYARREIDENKYLALRKQHIEAVWDLEKKSSAENIDLIISQMKDVETDPKYNNREGDRLKEQQKLQTEIDKAVAASGKAKIDYEKQVLEWKQKGYDIDVKNAELAMAREQKSFQDKVTDVKDKAALVDSNWRLTDQQKHTATLEALNTEIALYDDEIAKVQKLADLNQDPALKEKYANDLENLNRERKSTDTELKKQQQAPDPNSYGDQISLSFRNLSQTWGTQAQQMANILTSTVTSAVQGLSTALANVVMGTESAAQAFGQFALQMATQFIASVTQMILISQIAIPILTALGVLSGGSTVAAGAAITVPSVTAAVAGTAAYAHGFSVGGYVAGAPSEKDNVFATLATGEYVMRTRATQFYGAGLMEALNNMRVPKSLFAGYDNPVFSSRNQTAFAAGGLVGQSGAPVNVLPAPVNVALAVVNNREEFKAFMDKHGNAMAFDYVRKNSHKLGLATHR